MIKFDKFDGAGLGVEDLARLGGGPLLELEAEAQRLPSALEDVAARLRLCSLLSYSFAVHFQKRDSGRSGGQHLGAGRRFRDKSEKE